ncbi:MAG: CoA transferase subunit A [Nitrososphaerota archaeon]|nr:CoA transferase subunit A [Nitrososphaerota archaeon]MDG6939227.1 CoA transferase subunit A [Nitrososphaerota archaeon]
MVLDFVEARKQIEAKDHSMRDKLMPPEEAAKLVRDGDHMAIGGIMYSRTPMAMIREVIRRGVKGLTASRLLFSFESDMLFVAGSVDKAVTSWISMAVTWGVSKIMRNYVEGGKVKLEEWSHAGINLRYKAGAMGVPFLPTLSMLGSDLMKYNGAKEMDCPFTGRKLCLVPALYPDVAVIHVQRADRYGNVQVDGMPFADADLARASGRVIVTAEEIVSTDRIRREGDKTVIPFFCVDAVVEAPFGSYPHECPGLYQADYEHFHRYADTVAKKGVDGVKEYLQEYVYGPASYYDYLQKFHIANLMKNVGLSRRLVSD